MRVIDTLFVKRLREVHENATFKVVWTNRLYHLYINDKVALITPSMYHLERAYIFGMIDVENYIEKINA